ncbi:hypothetical protein JVT61DRAFT_12507 [Boletus reticuloceps]|uniref:Uncharacterized protein n=1 Tax=Boletus reticuloceps TaxID=495285 RepID=A0A8I3A3Y2_9AGAM|nr:hypothetical protein JVT61DRAFT_12507 [Boletus reticuloceps]
MSSKFHLVLEEDSARMTTEQLKELAEALSIMSAKSSVLEEGGERRALIAENLQAEEDSKPSSTKRTQTMHTKIDGQLDAYDPAHVWGRIKESETAPAVINHK